MPTYDYVCGACGHEFEHFQSMSDRLLRTCPACKRKKLVRKVGAGAGLIFKGTGFYITDYKKSSAPDAAAAAKGDAKPATDAAPAGSSPSADPSPAKPPTPSTPKVESPAPTSSKPPGRSSSSKRGK